MTILSPDDSTAQYQITIIDNDDNQLVSDTFVGGDNSTEISVPEVSSVVTLHTSSSGMSGDDLIMYVSIGLGSLIVCVISIFILVRRRKNKKIMIMNMERRVSIDIVNDEFPEDVTVFPSDQDSHVVSIDSTNSPVDPSYQEWDECTSDTYGGATFWHNKITGKSVWVNPYHRDSEWIEYTSQEDHHSKYWYNPITRTSVWEDPHQSQAPSE